MDKNCRKHFPPHFHTYRDIYHETGKAFSISEKSKPLFFPSSVIRGLQCIIPKAVSTANSGSSRPAEAAQAQEALDPSGVLEPSAQGTGEEVPGAEILDQGGSPPASVHARPVGQPGQGLVPEPAHEVETGGQGDWDGRKFRGMREIAADLTGS